MFRALDRQRRTCGLGRSGHEQGRRSGSARSAFLGFVDTTHFLLPTPSILSPSPLPGRTAHAAARPFPAACSRQGTERGREGLGEPPLHQLAGGSERGSAGPETGFVNVRQLLPLPPPPFSDRVPAPAAQRGRQKGRRRESEGRSRKGMPLRGPRRPSGGHSPSPRSNTPPKREGPSAARKTGFCAEGPAPGVPTRIIAPSALPETPCLALGSSRLAREEGLG